MPGKCTFNNLWLVNEKYKDWIKREADASRAGCKLCIITFHVGNMGESALASHAKSKKHLEIQKAAQQTASVGTYFTPDVRPGPTSATCTTARQQQPTLNQSIAASFDQLSAEVLWALKTVDSHYSYKSSANTSELFRAMFPDSTIA